MYACTCSAPPASAGEELGAGVQLACGHGCALLSLGAKALEVEEWQDFKEFGQAGHKPGQGPLPGGNQGAHGKNTRADGHLHASQSFQRVRICSSLRHQPRNSLATETPPKSICKNPGCPTTWSDAGATWARISWCRGLSPTACGTGTGAWRTSKHQRRALSVYATPGLQMVI